MLRCRCSISLCSPRIAAAAPAACHAWQWAPAPNKSLPASSFSTARSSLSRLETAKHRRGLLTSETSLAVPPVQLTLCHPFFLAVGRPSRGKLPPLGPYHCSGTSGQISRSFWVALPAMRHVFHCTDRSPALLCSQESPVRRSSGRAEGLEHTLHRFLERPKDF